MEYDALEMPQYFRRRGSRQEQQIRKLWEEPVVEYEDSHHRIDRAAILPRPKRRIPIWLGGSSEAAFDRSEEDPGWISVWRPDPNRGGPDQGED